VTDAGFGLALAALFCFIACVAGHMIGVADGHKDACEALCGEHYAWEEKCVCLAPVP
jgi:hypothetical protein